MTTRVVIAGRGAVTGFGRGARTFLDATFRGASAIAPRRRTAPFAVPTSVAAEVPADVLPPHDHAFFFAKVAAEEALAEAGEPARGSLALVLASTKGDLSGVVGNGIGLGQPWRLADRLAHSLGIGGGVTTISCACASGLVAIANAARRITLGEITHALVVGVDALHEFVMAGFGSVGALDPEPCRPFDRARRGVTLGEGAGALLLTSDTRASLGVVITGHGGANDACHVTGPDRQGAGLALAARRALSSANITTSDVDVLHVHGTGTEANDATEAIGLAALFAGRTPPAFGTKAQTGHTLGAAGVLESIVAIEALQRGIAAPNVGLADPSVDARLDLVREPRRLERSRRALKVASGFGGVQAAVVFEA